MKERKEQDESVRRLEKEKKKYMWHINHTNTHEHARKYTHKSKTKEEKINSIIITHPTST